MLHDIMQKVQYFGVISRWFTILQKRKTISSDQQFRTLFYPVEESTKIQTYKNYQNFNMRRNYLKITQTIKYKCLEMC